MGSYASKPICQAASKGDERAINEFLEAGGDVNERDDTGMVYESKIARTLLMYAAQTGEEGVVRILVKAGADLELRNEEGKTALHLAAEQGQLNSATILLEESVSRRATSEAGAQQYADVLTRLKDDAGRTALHLAAAASHVEVVRYFVAVDNGGSAVVADNSGSVSLHLATKTAIAEALLEAAPDRRETIARHNGGGFGVLHLCAREGNFLLLDFFLEQGADANALTRSGRSALQLVCSSSNPRSRSRSSEDSDDSSNLKFTQCAVLLLGRGARVGEGERAAAQDTNPALGRLLSAWNTISSSSGSSSPPPVLTETEAGRRVTELTAELEATERRLDEEKSRILCAVCLDTHREVMFQPCGHIVCCRRCAGSLTECPLDRRRIDGKVEFKMA